MSVQDIKKAWEIHEATPFPGGHRTKVVNGQNLSLIESEIGSYIMAFVSTDGRLGARQYIAMQNFVKILPQIIAELEGEAASYFSSLNSIAQELMKICKDPSKS